MKNHLPLKQASGWFKSIVLLLLFFAGTAAFGQDRNISGKVTDRATNESLPGASVVVKGTTKGVATDLDGNFNITVASGENILVVSFIGYDSQEITLGNQKIVNVALEASRTSLEEVVVVGYGSAKVKDLTSSITTIKAEDIARTPASQPVQALQGKVAGLQVVASGSPGSMPTVRLRGLGSYPKGDNASDPLYVVDGMFYENIDFLNPSDIASMSVLKDASAAAIYGVRAANGVILVETKSGQYNMKPQIVFDGYTGYQVAQNVVKMANAEQFTNMALESGSEADQTFILNAMQRYGRSRVNPRIPTPNTDWYSEILRPALISNNSLDFSGGTETIRYTIGGNYFFQNGIMNMKNDYERINLRTKLDIKATKWLTIGGNIIFSNADKNNPQAGAWNDAYFAVPIMPVYDEMNTEATPTNYSNAQNLGYRSGQNPFPVMDNNIDNMRIKKLLNNLYVEFILFPKTLTFRTSYNYSFMSLDQRIVNLPWFIGDNFKNLDPTITRVWTNENTHLWDNILTFNKSLGSHSITLMGGTSYRDEGNTILAAQGKNFPLINEKYWYIDQGDVNKDAVYDAGFREYGFSYFGRLAYNFKDRYLLYATLRADGTNKYQQTWGTFPTVGLGWVITEENFIPESNILNYLKIRASWGQLGNDNVVASSGTRTTAIHRTTFNGNVATGTIASSSFSFLKWELTEETNVGFTARFLNNKLSADLDYYIRDTKNAAIYIQPPFVRERVLRPVGTIRNSGVELALDWTNKVSDRLSYSIGANMSTLKNEATDLYGQQYIEGGTAEFLQRTYLNNPLDAFYGREVAGVYQNQAEIEADPVALENNLEPGDFKYVDQNGDGKVDDNDRVILGSYLPKFMYGGYINFTFANWDFSTSVYGQEGNKILNRRRGEIIWTSDGNLDADLAENRWHGEGTSDKYPSSKGIRKGWNQKMSDYFVEDGGFFRIQNIQLGYTIKNSNWLGPKFPVTRISIGAERPVSIFSYNGFTPEIANGIDTQTYPLSAIYTINLNIKF